MTIIRPNSIAGITSVTASGGDITYYKSDGTRGNQFTHNVSSTGVITATSFSGSTGTFSGDVTISGNLGVGGTITYEDVARVDATGISTFREGFGVGPLAGIALTAYKDGSIRTTGIITASNLVTSGIITASSLGGGTASNTKYLRGDGIWDTVTGTTINNNADNRLITGSGTANTLEGESTLTYDGAGQLNITGNGSGDGVSITNNGNHYTQITMDADRTSANNALGIIQGKWNNTSVCSIYLRSGSDTTNKDDGEIVFNTSETGSEVTRCKINNSGHLQPGATNTYDLGGPNDRWRDLYTQDLQLSNEAVEGGNDVDGTWGDYTIQEGENDLFLINNRNGKKYKFNLTEVN